MSAVITYGFARLPANRIPLEKPRSIQRSAKDMKPLVMGMTDPFLYNPRRVMNKVRNKFTTLCWELSFVWEQGQTILTQNEVVEFIVTLQNPYIFDLELEEISLRLNTILLLPPNDELTLFAQHFRGVFPV